MAGELTPKREKFVREYLLDLNGKRAAIRAGYAPGAADVEAVRLLGDANVKAELEKAQAHLAARVNIKQEQVVRQLALIAFSIFEDYTRQEGETRVLDLSGCGRDQLAAIQELTEDATGGSGDGERRQVLRTKLKLSDRTKALELLCRYLGMLKDSVKLTGDVTVTNTVADRLRAARKRVK